MATQYSCKPAPLPASRDIITNARPWLTATELKPLVTVRFVQMTVNPPDDQFVEIGSGETPSVVAPLNCGQSVLKAIEFPSSNKPKAVLNTHECRIGDAVTVSLVVGPVKSTLMRWRWRRYCSR